MEEIGLARLNQLLAGLTALYFLGMEFIRARWWAVSRKLI